MAALRRVLRRTFEDWEKEIARPIVVTVATAIVVFSLSLLLRPVRRFIFDDPESYPIYCTAESYSTSKDTERTEVVLINTTSRRLTRSDLEHELSGTERASGVASPDLHLDYTRDVGTINAAADAAFNVNKGELTVRHEGQTVHIMPQLLEPRAMLRVNIDVTGVPDSQLLRGVHEFVRFKIGPYEDACFTR